MRHAQIPMLTLAVSILAGAGCAGLAAGQRTIQVSQVAPGIAGTDQQNQAVSLRKLNAKKRVLVVFYRGHF